MKRVLSLVLAFLLVLPCAVFVPAVAEEKQESLSVLPQQEPAREEGAISEDGVITVRADKSVVEVDRETFDVYFDLNALTEPVGSIDFIVELSDNLEYVKGSAQVLITSADFMMFMFNEAEMAFGCGMTLAGVTGTKALLKLTVKAIAEGPASVSVNFQNGGIGNLVGDSKLDYKAEALSLEAVLHVCDFKNCIIEDCYLAGVATCSVAAAYYKSCDCGEYGEELFYVGSALGHAPVGVESDGEGHWTACARCSEKIDAASHEFDHEFDGECAGCDYTREVPMGTDGSIVIRADKSTVAVDKTIDVYFDLEALTAAGSVDFNVLLSDNLEYVSHQILISASDFMMSAFTPDNMYFGCGMTLVGVSGTKPLLKLTLKATAEGKATVGLTFRNGGGVGNVVGNGLLDYNAEYLYLDAVLHVCEFNLENPDARYLASAATCTEAATYYKSCECGEHASATFTYGKALGHSHGDWLKDENKHWHKCGVCGTVEHEADHSYSDFWDTDCNDCSYVRTRPLIGDANGDGAVSFGDIQRIYQHLSTPNKLSGDALIIADANKDGAVSFGDIQRIYQHLSTPNKLF